MWSLHVSQIHHDTDLRSSSNVYQTNWFILSGLFLTDGGMSVVPRHVQDPPSHRFCLCCL